MLKESKVRDSHKLLLEGHGCSDGESARDGVDDEVGFDEEA